MTDNEICSKIISLAECYMPQLAEKEQNITADTRINIDGFESLNFIGLICEIEGVYDIRIPDRVWSKLQTVGDVVAAVQNALKKKRK